MHPIRLDWFAAVRAIRPCSSVCPSVSSLLVTRSVELSAETPHVLVAGGPGSGRTGVLHTCLFALANHQSSSSLSRASARIILVDFRRSSRLLRSLPGVWMYADTEERLLEVVEALKSELEARTALLREELQSEEEEASRGEKMDPIVLVIDDYDMLNILAKNPLADLKEFLLRARDLRFHIIVAGSPNDLARPDALLQQVRSCRIGMILGGDPNDLPVLGVRMSDFPPGRGHLVHRNRRYLVQVAHVEAKEMISRLTAEASVWYNGDAHRDSKTPLAKGPPLEEGHERKNPISLTIPAT